MNLHEYENYLIPLVIVAFMAWRYFRFAKIKARLPGLIAGGAIVVDVRSPSEFQRGSGPGSINIPLDSLSRRASELDKNKTIILCCASGTRSGMAIGILKKSGFSNVINAGPGTNL